MCHIFANLVVFLHRKNMREAELSKLLGEYKIHIFLTIEKWLYDVNV